MAQETIDELYRSSMTTPYPRNRVIRYVSAIWHSEKVKGGEANGITMSVIVCIALLQIIL